MEKPCTKCGISKDIESNFYWRNRANNERHSACRACHKLDNAARKEAKRQWQAKYRAEHPEIVRANLRRWLTKYPDGMRAWHLKNKYGMSIADYDKMLEDQNGACAICGFVPGDFDRHLSIDHNHRCCPTDRSCGECVRGLLCHPCNVLVGFARDSSTILDGASNYLRRYAKINHEVQGSAG